MHLARPSNGGDGGRGESDSALKIKAVAPWFGSKRNLAPRIVEMLGKHVSYWEPFCGSLAVLFAKPVSTIETANDLHGDLINLCRVLKCEKTAIELYGRASRMVMHEDLFTEAAQRYRDRGNNPADDEPDIDRADAFLVCSWYGRNGVAGTKSYNQGFCLRFTKNGGHAAKRWLSVVESIPDWHWRLRNVTILNRDAFELLERIEDAKRVVIYVDSPYIVKGAKYIHDFTADDHARLAAALSRFKKTRVIVSYYDHPQLTELYPGWQRRTIEVTKSLVNQGMRDCSGAKKAQEVLLSNEPAGLFA